MELTGYVRRFQCSGLRELCRIAVTLTLSPSIR